VDVEIEMGIVIVGTRKRSESIQYTNNAGIAQPMIQTTKRLGRNIGVN
jgi:hypothetical protein